ncbi:hypothetical protein GH714_036466 [Hevea brasiliensis]|uniref:Uncharacterized protein n=1 Tax=Hevea brasiliensis TaxID=3981 RepID=A0A6A6M3G0_HEVBR|nr:hypothetical protein GH714_036466 [Hevea brasiliensis]
MSRRDQEAKTTIEVQATKVARAEADQASGSHDQLVDENKATGSHSQLIEESQKLSILIHEKPRSTCSWQDRLNSLKLGPENENPASRIQKVPFMLRENKEFEKYYKPKMVAIGPIHHRDPNFEFTEKRKHIVAGDFIKEHGIDAENLYDKIMDGLGNLKMRYVEDVIKDYTDDELAWMFLVDGCAILHFIHCVVNDEKNDPQYSAKLEKFNFKKNQVAYAQQDLFLFENQLPYQLLELLISSVVQNKEREDIRESIRNFIDMNLMTPESTTKSRQGRRKPSKSHLLELLWEELTDGILPQSGGLTMHSFRNVKELMTSGIQLKASSENSLNISFNQFASQEPYKFLPWL